MEGAGGIGGMLARSSGYSGGNWSTHYFYHADGNGNITYLVDASQALAASYRYDSFGNTLSSSGSQASANVYRFSSKEVNIDTGMYYYGYRFYDPILQRWLNRDPIAEFGGLNLYTFVDNEPPDLLDPWGLADLCDVLKKMAQYYIVMGDIDKAEKMEKMFNNLGCKPPGPNPPGGYGYRGERPPEYRGFRYPPNPSLNRGWECIRGGPPHITGPFQLPELDPIDRVTVGIGVAGLGILAPPIIITIFAPGTPVLAGLPILAL
jgi:RHS repeat-associated protein